MKIRSVIKPVVRMGLMSLILMMGLSCSTIFTNQEDCPRGVALTHQQLFANGAGPVAPAGMDRCLCRENLLLHSPIR